ncbi:MAG: acyl-CoA dehydrogenase family protein [Candidatus Reddybacter sp.]
MISYKIAEMAKRIHTSQVMMERTALQMHQHEVPVIEFSLLNVHATETMEYCAREAL